MLNLTSQERQAIIFIISIGLIGIGTDFCRKRFRAEKTFRLFSENLGKININEADSNLLLRIPGVGVKTANRIIEYRQIHNNFSNIEELKEIEGITDKKFQQMKDDVFVR